MTAEFVASEEFPADLATPAAARRFVVDTLRTAGVEFTDAVPLAVSELVTNAVLHASSPTRVEVLVEPEAVRVEVQDADPTLPEPRRPTPETLTGRGLMLVEAVTDRWGARPTGVGKVVWFEFDR